MNGRRATAIALLAGAAGACASPPRATAPAPVVIDTSTRMPSFDEAIERLAGRFAQHAGRVAVLDFPDLSRRQTPLGRLVSQSLTTSLVTSRNDGRVRVLERLQVEQVLKELRFAAANVTDDAVEHIGKALNADALIFGTAVPSGGSTVIINARMVEVAGRSIIEAGRVTARVPVGIGVDGLSEPLSLMNGALGSGESDGPGDGSAISAPRSAPRRQGAFASAGSTTWIFELQQCTSLGDARVTCDVSVTNDGPVTPLALFFEPAQIADGYTRIVDDHGIAHGATRLAFSPSGPAYGHDSLPAPSVATASDIRRYPSQTPVRLSVEVDGVEANVSRLRIVELVGGTSLAGFHDVVATFRDVPIQHRP